MKPNFLKIGIFIFLTVVSFLFMSPEDSENITNTAGDFPYAKITNNLISAKIYLPDVENGYYRGTRFDWSGVIASLEFNGHQYFGRWFDEYDPFTHDSILGPVEEFSPLGFDEADSGDHFVKIGVGLLQRSDDDEYRFSFNYDVVDYGKWTVKTYKNGVEFTHELSDVNGYSYVYQKIVQLAKGKPQLVLKHRLLNTGKRLIDTSVYNHNFFVIDDEPTGPEIRTIFPFKLSADGRGFGNLIEVAENELRYKRKLEKGEFVFSSGLKGFENSADDNDIRIENLKTGAGVRIKGDHPLEKLVFWASSTTSCPEPYIHLQVKPNREIEWENRYEFYVIN